MNLMDLIIDEIVSMEFALNEEPSFKITPMTPEQNKKPTQKKKERIQTNVDKYIDKVIFNNPATIIYWKDGSKTIVKCQEGDTYNAETGFAMAVCKKVFSNNGNFNEVLKKWIPNY